MKIKKTILSSLIFLSFGMSSIANINAEVLETATNDGSKDIKKILENNDIVSKKSYLLDYYKQRGSSGKLSVKQEYNLDKPMSLDELSLLKHSMFKDGHRNIDIEELNELVSNEGSDELKNLRENSVYNEALKIGIQNGLFKALYTFKEKLEVLGMEYEQIFNFKELMLFDGKVIPPIILIMDSGVSKESSLGLRMSDAQYNIYKQAEVTLKAPTYFDYLNFEPIKPQKPENILLPINDRERKLWKQGSEEGWVLGIKQGNSIINEGLHSLSRDYYGMQSFHLLRKVGAISMPELDRFEIGTTTDGNVLNIGELKFEIKILPQFNANSQNWKAIPQLDNFLYKEEF